MRGEGFDAAQNSCMERAHAHGRLQACDQTLDRQAGVGGQRDRDGGFLVAVHARDDRNDDAFRGGDLRAEQAGGSLARRGTRLGDDHSGRLDRDEGGWRIGPFGFDDRKSAGGAQRVNQVGRRIVGDHDHRTLKRHGGARTLYMSARP